MPSIRGHHLILLLFVLLPTGCAGKRDPAVEAEIQKRYEAQDAAFASRDPKAVMAFCAAKYEETNSDLISANIAPPSSVSVSLKGRVGVEKPRQHIASLSQYETFLKEYFSETQSVSMTSKTYSAFVNDKKDRASVSLNRDIQVTLAAPEGKPAMAVLIEETLSDKWIKEPGKGWVKSESSIDRSFVKRDRGSEAEQ